ncbi:leucyl/phenylalanyl-tRNA--protein transferase [Rhodoplanes sp. TEM]|uniref:Leucyl/phenylalanyl-tRNA--protein transferase n=1 Tax=Rhodoplanes tepidamans TaxID=200616 RepID=A0ABT5JJB9_RHOTP|nr:MULTISPECIES: leucyl/phenylalanyl-tRNA--protein transferase [Rhodoplanes]MDC7789394.1 leucyl/phenylalanyl-tRNA--protein transferase [Rhodoplanes tepidamans]MDC7986478.1 leucyl/phenylalanyl-tRNA--protein transferase [Rhodoplanes sp. TEM]MDQ0358971.1 leucyl/phenylalanyl-tRNA--protein transferase [Rhodoplanes tepidamans]
MTPTTAVADPAPDSPGACDARRRALFHESLGQRLQRVALGTAWALKPPRLQGLPGLARLWALDLVDPAAGLPDPDRTVNPFGICGIVHDPSPATVLAAYREGLFPFAHVGPLKWVSPAERCILRLDELHIAKRLRRQMRQGRYTVTFDRDFPGVITACAGRREGRWHLTWITPRIMRLYADMFDAGQVHSFEVWNEAGALVGGGYGVAAGGAFFTESQFSHEPNTSKIGFTVLHWHLARWGFRIDDGKWPTPTILDMGFRTVPRGEFRALLADAPALPGKPGRWSVETDLATVAAWQPGGAGKPDKD